MPITLGFFFGLVDGLELRLASQQLDPELDHPRPEADGPGVGPTRPQREEVRPALDQPTPPRKVTDCRWIGPAWIYDRVEGPDFELHLVQLGCLYLIQVRVGFQAASPLAWPGRSTRTNAPGDPVFGAGVLNKRRPWRARANCSRARRAIFERATSSDGSHRSFVQSRRSSRRLSARL